MVKCNSHARLSHFYYVGPGYGLKCLTLRQICERQYDISF
jgi:hypothetical protein